MFPLPSRFRPTKRDLVLVLTCSLSITILRHIFISVAPPIIERLQEKKWVGNSRFFQVAKSPAVDIENFEGTPLVFPPPNPPVDTNPILDSLLKEADQLYGVDNARPIVPEQHHNQQWFPSSSSFSPDAQESLPMTKIARFAPGFAMFDNLYMSGGTFYIVSDQPYWSFPEIRLITSTGLVALADEENIKQREPSERDMAFLTPEEAVAMWGNRVWTVGGLTVNTLIGWPERTSYLLNCLVVLYE